MNEYEQWTLDFTCIKLRLSSCVVVLLTAKCNKVDLRVSAHKSASHESDENVPYVIFNADIHPYDAVNAPTLNTTQRIFSSDSCDAD